MQPALRLSIVIILASAIFSCSSKKTTYTMALVNGKIWTGNPAQPWAEALLISGDSIVMVGTDDEIRSVMGATENVIDAGKRLVVPGFIDCHVHTLMGGQRLSSVKLKNVRTKDEFIRSIAAYAKTLKPGEWILGGDWDHQNWGGELPTHEWIDSVTRDNPLWLERSEGHSGLANVLALRKAGVTRETADITGGTIERDKKGEPTGVFKDDAMSLIFKAIPDLSDSQKERALNDAMDYFLSEGITSAHHMTEPHDRNLGGQATDYAAFRKLNNEGKLRVRFYIAEPFTDAEAVAARIAREGRGDKWLKAGALKGYVDGAIGSHSALFYDDYTDLKGYKGSQVNTKEFLYDRIKTGDSLGLQVFIHAIGDKGIHYALEAFDSVMRHNGTKDPRFRIEHTQHIAPSDLSYMGKLGVIASMQPYHTIDDGIWCERAIGPERIRTTYAFRSLSENQVKMAFGSDWFVAPPSPLKGIYAAVTRRTLDGKNPDGWVPEQKIGVEEALRSYTIDAAYSGFEEKIKGSLVKGKLADFVILEQNIFEVDPASLIDARVKTTVVGGKVAFNRK